MLTYTIALDAKDALEGLTRLKEGGVKNALVSGAYRLALQVKRYAVLNLSGFVMRSRGTVNDLRIFTSAQKPEVDETAVWWGLPADEQFVSKGPGGPTTQMGRIGAFFESGGTIVPHGHPMLRIPMPSAQTGAGYDRWAGVQFRDMGKGFQGLFVWPSARQKALRARLGGRLFLARTTGKGGKFEVLYRLKSQVTIKPHPWFSRAIELAEKKDSELMERFIAWQLDREQQKKERLAASGLDKEFGE